MPNRPKGKLYFTTGTAFGLTKETPKKLPTGKFIEWIAGVTGLVVTNKYRATNKKQLLFIQQDKQLPNISSFTYFTSQIYSSQNYSNHIIVTTPLCSCRSMLRFSITSWLWSWWKCLFHLSTSTQKHCQKHFWVKHWYVSSFFVSLLGFSW